jgi:hypothetical protein
VVVVVYLAEYVSGEILAGEETQEIKLFSPGSIPWGELAFPSTVDALRDYCNLKNVG